jgi:hypothetical protein
VASIPDVTGFFNLRSPYSCSITLWSTHPLKEITTRNLSGGGKGLLANEAGSFTAIYGAVV